MIGHIPDDRSLPVGFRFTPKESSFYELFATSARHLVDGAHGLESQDAAHPTGQRLREADRQDADEDQHRPQPLAAGGQGVGRVLAEGLAVPAAFYDGYGPGLDRELLDSYELVFQLRLAKRKLDPRVRFLSRAADRYLKGLEAARATG